MKYMKKNLWYSIGSLIIGLMCIGVFAFVSDENISAKSMAMGVGCALLAVGITNLIVYSRLLKNPRKCEEIEVCKTEERTVFLREKNNSMVYTIFIYIECALTIISGFLGYSGISLVLSLLILAKLIAWGIVASINNKRY